MTWNSVTWNRILVYPFVCYCLSLHWHVHKILFLKIRVPVFVGMFFFMIWILLLCWKPSSLQWWIDYWARQNIKIHTRVPCSNGMNFIPLGNLVNSYPACLQQLSQTKCSLCTVALLSGSDNGFCSLSYMLSEDEPYTIKCLVFFWIFVWLNA